MRIQGRKVGIIPVFALLTSIRERCEVWQSDIKSHLPVVEMLVPFAILAKELTSLQHLSFVSKLVHKV